MSWTWDATLPLLRTEPLIPQWKSLLAENGYIAHFMLTAKGQHTSPQLRMDTKSWLSFLLGDNSEGSTPLQSSLGDQLRPVMRLCLLPKPASPSYLSIAPHEFPTCRSFASEPVSGKSNLRHLSLFSFCGDVGGHMFPTEQLEGGQPFILPDTSHFLTDHLSV